MNYFELFGFEMSPSVDKTLVSQKYFILQKNNHPDFFTQATEDEQEEALQQSAAINKAFAIFQNEEKNIEYFLQVKGVILPDEKYQLSPDFLMEMMELNEAISEKNSININNELAAIEKPLYEEIKPILDQPAAEYDASDLEKLKSYYYKKKYLKRILDRLDD
jgi:molecular chaperone HscB